MKKLVLFVFLFASFQAFGQFPNYTNINGRYKWIAGKFDSTFTIPSGTTPSLRTGGGTGPGALFYRTTDSTVYQYTGTQWIKLRAGVSPTDTAGIWISNVYRKTGTDSVYYVKGGTSTFAFRDSIGNVGGGGGGGKIYYFNGGVNLGTFGGITMYELGDTAVTSAAANFTRATTGNLANFITDVNRPGLLQIPAGVWTVDAYLSETGGGSNHAQIWIEVEKWNGSTITTIATSPIEEITNGNVIDLYTWAVSIPTTTLAVTDRIIIQFYITNTNGKTVTLYTQNGYVGEVHTTFTTGIGSLNGLTAPTQYFATGTSGTDFAISSSTATHTFNLPTASGTNRGALSSADWTTFNGKVGGSGTTNYLPKFTASGTIGNSQIFDDGTNVGIGTASPSYLLDVNGTARVSGSAVFNTATNTSSIQDLFSQPTFSALYLDQATPSLSNYAIASNGTNTLVNAASTSVILRIANSDRAVVYSNGNLSSGTLPADIGFSLNLTSAGSSGLIRAGNFTYGAGGRFVHFNYGDETQTSSNYSIYYETGDLIFNTKTGGVFKYRINNIDVARIFTNGNFSIGYGLSPTDAGYKLDVNGTTRLNGNVTIGASTLILSNQEANQVLRITAPIGIQISSDKWISITSSSSYIQNGFTTKNFVSTTQSNGNFSSFDFSNSNSYTPTIANPYTQKLINGAMTINSTAATNSFHGVSISTTDNSASIANNVFAVYADATLGTNTSATRWAGYFVGRGYFSGDVGIGTTSPTAKLHVVYAPAVIGATFTSARIVAGSGQVNQTATALSLESSGTNGGEATYTGLNVSANSRAAITGVNSVVSKNWGGATLAGNAIGVLGSATTDSPTGVAYGGSFVGVSNAGTTYGLYANVTGSGTRIPFAVAVSGTEAMRVSSSSNLLVGTTTDAGQKLQISGGAAIAAVFENSGTNAGLRISNSTYPYLVLNRSGTINRAFGIFNASGDIAIQESATWSGAYYHIFYGTGGYSTTGSGHFGNNVAANASAVLEATSTTKGFLPPRMTGAQAEAIGTPAAGLMVYSTDGSGATITSLGWWGYNGTTWVKLN